MKVVNPYTGLVVDAPKDVAERLMAQGFKADEKPKPKPAPKRRTAPKKTE